MAKRLKTAPRKAPQQSRAQDTVDAILAATVRLIVSSGYDTMSTNRIAIAAGVSIGSLYQYFPSKEAIVAQLVEKHCKEMAVVSQLTLEKHVNSPLPIAARAVVQAMVLAKRVNPKLHQAFREQVPRVGKLMMIDEQHGALTVAVTNYLKGQQAILRIADPEISAFFVVKTVDALLQHIASEPLASRGDERIIDEIVDMIVVYLSRGV